MLSVKQAINRTALNFAELLTPVLINSKFRETGVINPEEFVAAGDFLVHHCPTWFWSSGDDSKIKPYLPPDKQFLMTRSVPCCKRLKQVAEHDEKMEMVLDLEEGSWVDTHHFSTTLSEKPQNIEDACSSQQSEALLTKADDDEPMDMENFLDSGLLDSLDVASVSDQMKRTLSLNADCEIVSSRTYDLYITYDKYYRTSRLWLQGYDENKKPLGEEQMYEDFSQDHAKKTVTMESHPHFENISMPSVHPCKQSEVMKRLINTVAENGTQLEVYQYIMIFLKFVSAVIPTIEYDYTRTFNL